MEVKYGIIIIVAVTVAISMFAIIVGCNEAFSNEDNGISSAKICESYSTLRSTGTSPSPFEKCIIKQENRGNMCIDYFSWLKF